MPHIQDIMGNGILKMKQMKNLMQEHRDSLYLMPTIFKRALALVIKKEYLDA